MHREPQGSAGAGTLTKADGRGCLAALFGLPTTTPTIASPRAIRSSWRALRRSTTRIGSVNKRHRTGSSSGPSPEEARSTPVAHSKLPTQSFGTHVESYIHVPIFVTDVRHCLANLREQHQPRHRLARDLRQPDFHEADQRALGGGEPQRT